MIELDVANRRLHLDVSEDELSRRRADLQTFENRHLRGYSKMYVEHVTQADTGADFDFLIGRGGTPKLRESH